MQLRRDQDGLGTVVFDRPGDTINVLDAAAIEALEAVVADCEREPPTALLFLSGKDHFCMGADVSLIASLATRADAEEGSRRGQALFARLAALPCPTVIAIRGSCLGGGLEWALACDRILASDHRRTVLGLPEVKLGLVPGWGGTQRLPARAGLGPAVEWIASGRTLPAALALERGLVDQVVPDDRLEDEARAVARALGRRRRKPRPRRQVGMVGLAARWLPAVRRAVFQRVEREVARRAGAPLPRAAGGGGRRRVGVRPAGRGRTGTRAAAVRRSGGRRGVAAPRAPVDHDGSRPPVVRGRGRRRGPGAPRRRARRRCHGGRRGPPHGGRAASRSCCGRSRPARSRPACSACGRWWRRTRARGRLTAPEAAALLDRIRPTLELAEIANADVVLEAVVEDLDIKKRVLLEAALAAPGAVLATNTSALPIAAMAQGLPDPARLAGLHFFNPVHRMPLVEVVVPSGPRRRPRGR